jgi:hypothetical protein
MKSCLAAALLLGAWAVKAGTTIDTANRHSYGANLGWMDWVADTNHGALIGDWVCSGWIYSANAGWIGLGSGSPADGIRYQNNSAADFGVNNDGAGNLSGYAWGANIGWVNFAPAGAPKVNLLDGHLSGSVWSANCGWISLSNAVANVQTDALYPGPLAPDGLPVPWLLTYFGTTNVNPDADPTGKGMTIAQDYLAGTSPNTVTSVLRITSRTFTAGDTHASLTWESVATRLYYVQVSTNLAAGTWTDSGLGPIAPSAGPTTSASFTESSDRRRFYRVQALIPLPP